MHQPTDTIEAAAKACEAYKAAATNYSTASDLAMPLLSSREGTKAAKLLLAHYRCAMDDALETWKQYW